MARYKAGLRTQARIIEATRDLLSESGLDGTTLKEICDRAGVRAGSFYNLFESKEEVVLNVVGEAIAAVDPDPDGRHIDTVPDLVEAYVSFVSGSPEMAKIYLQIAVGGALADGVLHKRLVGHHEERVRRFAEAYERTPGAPPPGHRITAAEMLLATLNGLAFRWILDPDFDFAGHARGAVAG